MTIEEINKLIKEKRRNLTENEKSIWIDGWVDGYLEGIVDCVKYSIGYEKEEANRMSFIRELYVPSHADAIHVMYQLYHILDTYGYVSCNYLYGLKEIDKTCPLTYENYGWYDLDNASIINNGDGTWSFDLPKPVHLNRKGVAYDK